MAAGRRRKGDEMATHPAQALTVFPQTGPSRSYVREEDDGESFWCLAQPTFGRGAPHEPVAGSPRLSPRALIAQLSAELE
jgi:hypothetical protein